MNLFELTLLLKGFPIAKARERLKEIQSIPESEYIAYLVEGRQRIVNYHLKENSFYKSFFGNDIDLKWEDIPVMHKKDLQIPLQQRLSNGFTKSNCYVNKTSGSSGHPFIFAKDKFCHALTWVEIMDRYGWYDLDFSNSYQARFYGIPLDFKGYQKERLKDKLSSRYRFPVFDLSDEKLEQFLSIFKRKKFDYVYGYTSSVVLFAKYLKRNKIQFHQICPSVKYCIVTSEMLFESDKKLLEEQFGVPVINEYGASELDLIAYTDKNGKFKINNETIFVEILDENNKPVANGVKGRIVITSLYNKAHPLIRYDVGDEGIISTESSNKYQIMEKLVGRTNDIAKVPGGKTIPGLTFYYITKSVIEEDGNVKEFIVEQKKLDSFHIVYVSTKPLSEKELNKIEKSLSIYVESDLKVTFERVNVLDRSRRGKLKQFVSEI